MGYIMDDLCGSCGLPSPDEIAIVISNVQSDIWESTGGVEYINICYINGGYIDIIEFCGIEIWNSDNDNRRYVDEEMDIREPLEDYVRRTINEELVNFSNIKV
jgi:hypothetical protein